MEMQMNSINNLRNMEVIEVTSGSRLGYIRDLKIDCDDYKIVSIILPSQKVSWFNKNNYIEIPWSKITKVGVDVILVDAQDLLMSNIE